MERQKQIKDIGKLSGTALVFGGVYSNFQALAQMKQVATDNGISPDNIICTGDVVAYCAQPEECVQSIKEWGIHVIAGNVEIQLAEGSDDCGCNFESGTTCNLLSNQWYPYAQSNLSTASIDWMSQLPDFIKFEFAGQKGFVLHGSFDETAEFIFKSTLLEKKKEVFETVEADLIIAGHCGLPFYDRFEEKLWINPGVIGMPANDGTTDVWYAILTEVEGGVDVAFHRLSYDYHQAATLMEENALPSQYSKTLRSGIWDNCDILPEIETCLQGKRIEI